MATESLIYGLAPRHYLDVGRVFAGHPSIERVVIFGSRAQGTARPEADFDLAVVAPTMTDTEFSSLWVQLEALPLAFKLDVLHLDRLNHGQLKAAILTKGKVFWPLPITADTSSV